MHAAHALEHCFETPRLGTQEGVVQKETLQKNLILRWNMYTRICVPSRFSVSPIFGQSHAVMIFVEFMRVPTRPEKTGSSSSGPKTYVDE